MQNLSTAISHWKIASFQTPQPFSAMQVAIPHDVGVGLCGLAVTGDCDCDCGSAEQWAYEIVTVDTTMRTQRAEGRGSNRIM